MPEKTVEILLIEDNPEDAKLVIEVFREYHPAAHVELVRDGATALDFIFSTGAYATKSPGVTPGLILLGLRLPKVSGIEVLKVIKSYARTSIIPVVVFTSSPEERTMLESYQLGANSYVFKPVDRAAFRQAIQNVGFYWLNINKNSDSEIQSEAENP